MRAHRVLEMILLLLLSAAVSCGDRGGGDGQDGTADGDDPGAETDASSDGAGDGEDDGPCVPEEEICNYIDDDCDDVVDNGFDLTSDPLNCGACDVSCEVEHTSATCEDSVCVVEGCEDGWHDVDGDPFNGCEYECEATSGAEDPDDGTCTDGIDNDCDGRTDDEDTDCSDCVPEICNGLDDDCDTLIDEDFDLDTDPLNCGSCSNACPHRPHATVVCDSGECGFECESGWMDVDGDPSNGCEELCTPVPGGTETACNGIDEDCDGAVDEDYVNYTCGIGACVTTSTCVSGTEDCTPLAPPYTTDEICNDFDDDCDGSVDEEYIPYTCGTGVCERDSTCISGMEDCTPGSPSGSDDICDGLDQDCDGTADEHWIPYTCGLGVCVRTATCTGGVVGCTPGSPTGSDSYCDGIDQDCDGTADEHWAPYTCGWGQCEATATCVSGADSCTPRNHDSLWPTTWASREMDVLAEMNAERAAGATCTGTWYPPVPALTMDTALREAARCHSLDMAENDFFSHTGTGGVSPWTRISLAGYTGSARGENIAAGQSTPAGAVASWMSSTAGHCEMIMSSSVNEVGIGYSYSSSARWDHYWTADFGWR